jgi:hypothetical protein
VRPNSAPGGNEGAGARTLFAGCIGARGAPGVDTAPGDAPERIGGGGGRERAEGGGGGRKRAEGGGGGVERGDSGPGAAIAALFAKSGGGCETGGGICGGPSGTTASLVRGWLVELSSPMIRAPKGETP